MEREPTTNQCFVMALRKKLKKEGYGAQKKLANGVGLSTKHLNDIIQGRRNASLGKMESIASYYKLHLEEMLTVGRSSLSEGEILTLPSRVIKLQSNSVRELLREIREMREELNELKKDRLERDTR